MNAVSRGFNDIIHPQPRLSIMAMLAAAERLEFGYIRDSIGLSDSALSKQLSTLEQAGYLEIKKSHLGRVRWTYVQLTHGGRLALGAHVHALQTLLAVADPPPVS
ncbi:winged helix-turn-helix domain-containing protein [Actinoplanes sp. NPDC051859]|uniref:winged helix-turn-helix domain-containing protein n=1 Tax=Actinoplanes sp. NPDC051859 TaxID=3363909 RepID=UPI0037B44163